ncbi:DNA polymerase III subunit tau [Nymphon striatum]|nr:DNA polymerase III subunit tau [Nymphon striatum]
MSDTTDGGYQVLARKYRPATFADLIGQDAMVRTLKNAFEAGRIAQAFIMTGIRGTGKTTTARIIAKGMNCTGADGTGGPTTEPCGVCDNCVAIAEGRHVDVMEMDAASRTGVGDIPRYKIYIIDEVHMLSTSAFNALLKTLEEPPEHVKFIFATTEIRKVPVTVLSRCQRFDLRRIEPEDQIALLRKIADAEGGEISDEALALITRAAEGSARDAQSLLDQAISHGAGETTATQVRAMLGLADRDTLMLKGLGNLGDMAGMMKKAKEMQDKMTQMQDDLQNIEVQGESGAGLVKATATAKGILTKLDIDPSIFHPDEKEVVEDLILAAIKDAQTKATEKAAAEMSKITEEMGIPAGMKLPF